MKRVASIDMGTNTFRLLIAELGPDGSLQTHYSENRIVRLGEGFSRKKWICAEAGDRALTSLKYFKTILEKEKVLDLIVTGTSALREAENREVFLGEVLRETGFSVKIISGLDEARYTLRGVQLVIPDITPRNEALVVIDIGGGSTEIIVSTAGQTTDVFSLSLGAVRESENYLRSDPPTETEIQRLKQKIRFELKNIFLHLPSRSHLIGTAGTITTLAAIKHQMRAYKPDLINQTVLSGIEVTEILNRLVALPLKKRKRVSGLEADRADIVIAGILILAGIMEEFKFESLRVSDAGLREGALLEHFCDAN